MTAPRDPGAARQGERKPVAIDLGKAGLRPPPEDWHEQAACRQWIAAWMQANPWPEMPPLPPQALLDPTARVAAKRVADKLAKLAAAYEQLLADVWQEGGERTQMAAKQVCLQCPVRDACLAEELKIEANQGLSPGSARYGIRGGMTPSERRTAYALATGARRVGYKWVGQVPA